MVAASNVPRPVCFLQPSLIVWINTHYPHPLPAHTHAHTHNLGDGQVAGGGVAGKSSSAAGPGAGTVGGGGAGNRAADSTGDAANVSISEDVPIHEDLPVPEDVFVHEDVPVHENAGSGASMSATRGTDYGANMPVAQSVSGTAGTCAPDGTGRGRSASAAKTACSVDALSQLSVLSALSDLCVELPAGALGGGDLIAARLTHTLRGALPECAISIRAIRL